MSHSTPRLSESARHVVLPDGIVSTGWPAVRDKCAQFGVTFDAWQDGAGSALLGKRSDGVYACSIGGAVLSIPRQVGKTFLIGAIIFALCLLKPGTKVLWTAHRLRTADETFAKMQAFAGRKKIKPYVANIYIGSGTEEIVFTNGSRILFGARERGFGRGFDDVDVEVFDEAQILTENAIDDMVPATNTAANPLLIFMGTPPKPTDPSEVFLRKRADALSGEDGDTLYIEFSADPGCDPVDRKQWKKANPSYPSRTNDAAMQRMRKNLTDESFVREALGIWDEEELSVHPLPNWDQLKDERSEVAGSFAWSLVVTKPGRTTWSTIAFAGVREDGRYHVEVGDNRPGTDGLIERCVAIWEQERVPVRVHNVKDAIEAAYIAELQARGVEVDEVSTTKFAHATGLFTDAAETFRLSHLGQGSLSGAVDRAEVVKSVWVEKHPGADIGPLKAATIALGGVPDASTVKVHEPVFIAT